MTIVHVEVAQNGATFCAHFRSSDSRLLPLGPASSILTSSLYTLTLASGSMFHSQFEVRS